jgi:hypothetical protein
MRLDRFQRVWADGSIVLDVELGLEPFALRSSVSGPACRGDVEVTEGVLAADQSECYCLTAPHPLGCAKSCRISGHDRPSQVVGVHRGDLSSLKFLLGQIVYPYGGFAGSGEQPFATVMEYVQRADHILLGKARTGG